MEIDRIKALKAYEERERRRAEEQKKGASIIVEQIREREQERIREEERRDMERQQMMAELERLQGEVGAHHRTVAGLGRVAMAVSDGRVCRPISQEMRAREAGKAKARKLMEEVMVTNRQQLEMKKLSKQEELEEDMRIAEYIRQRCGVAKAGFLFPSILLPAQHSSPHMSAGTSRSKRWRKRRSAFARRRRWRLPGLGRSRSARRTGRRRLMSCAPGDTRSRQSATGEKKNERSKHASRECRTILPKPGGPHDVRLGGLKLT